MSWFTRKKVPLGKSEKRNIPDGLFLKCEECGETQYRADFEKAMRVCQKCGRHHILPALKRIDQLIDEGTFEEHDGRMLSTDPLKFRDSKKYGDRLKSASKSADTAEAVICGSGRLNGWRVEICSFEFAFMGGSMGSVVGEKITRASERAMDWKCPLITVSCSGGARMQEGMYSLMQMAKTAASIGLLGEAGLPYISLLTHPTAGGVTASFAMLGDVILAEPDALICFAGPRVIEQTIKQKLPDGFQRSEFLLAHGFVDSIVKRDETKDKMTAFIKHMSAAIPPGNRPDQVKPEEEPEAEQEVEPAAEEPDIEPSSVGEEEKDE